MFIIRYMKCGRTWRVIAHEGGPENCAETIHTRNLEGTAYGKLDIFSTQKCQQLNSLKKLHIIQPASSLNNLIMFIIKFNRDCTYNLTNFYRYFDVEEVLYVYIK